MSNLIKVTLTYDCGKIVEINDKVAVLVDAGYLSVDYDCIGITDERITAMATVLTDPDVEITIREVFLMGGGPA
jgi:hypothetical protein